MIKVKTNKNSYAAVIAITGVVLSGVASAS